MPSLHAIRFISFQAEIFRRTQNLVAKQLADGICPTCLGTLTCAVPGSLRPSGAPRNTHYQVMCAECALNIDSFTPTQRTLHRIAMQIVISQASSTLADELTEDKSSENQNSDRIDAELTPNRGSIAPEPIHGGS